MVARCAGAVPRHRGMILRCRAGTPAHRAVIAGCRAGTRGNARCTARRGIFPAGFRVGAQRCRGEFPSCGWRGGGHGGRRAGEWSSTARCAGRGSSYDRAGSDPAGGAGVFSLRGAVHACQTTRGDLPFSQGVKTPAAPAIFWLPAGGDLFLICPAAQRPTVVRPAAASINEEDSPHEKSNGGFG